jgi:predicted MFS family arabinose efflux permease
VESEDLSPRRLTVAGAVLVTGLLVGVILSGTFGWSPYFWQWLGYHNALIVCVIIYLLLPHREPEPGSRKHRLPGVALGRSVRSKVAEIVFLEGD